MVTCKLKKEQFRVKNGKECYEVTFDNRKIYVELQVIGFYAETIEEAQARLEPSEIEEFSAKTIEEINS